jgi:hypothetical protein
LKGRAKVRRRDAAQSTLKARCARLRRVLQGRYSSSLRKKIFTSPQQKEPALGDTVHGMEATIGV